MGLIALAMVASSFVAGRGVTDWLFEGVGDVLVTVTPGVTTMTRSWTTTEPCFPEAPDFGTKEKRLHVANSKLIIYR